MRTSVLTLLLALSLLSAHNTSRASAQSAENFEKIKLTSDCQPTDDSGYFAAQGVEIMFSGLVDNRFIVISGCCDTLGSNSAVNEPSCRNVFYAPASGQPAAWSKSDKALGETIYKGLSVSTSTGLLLIEQQNPTKNRVFKISSDGNHFSETMLCEIPDNAKPSTATEYNGKLYIASLSLDSPQLYVLDLQNPQRNLTSLPSPTAKNCTYATSSVQSNGFDNCLYIFCQNEKTVSAHSYNLRLGTWSDIYLPKEFNTIQGKTSFPKGANHIMFAGGNRETIGIYHTISNTYTEKPCEGLAQIANPTLFTSNGKKVIMSTNGNQPRISVIDFERTKNGFATLDIIVIILYFCALAMIGIYFSRRQKSSDDYFKGGGRIPWWAAGLSLFGTALSAITFMAIPAKAFATNWSYVLFNTGIVLVAPVIMFVFIPFFRKLNITTAYEYLEVRFNGLIRVLCSLAFIIFQVGRMGVVLFLPSIALNVVTGVDIFLCITLMSVFSIIYTMIGGIEAVVWTDALQVVILLGGALFAICYIAGDIPGGFGEIFSVAGASEKFSLGDTRFDLSNSSMWTVLIAACFTHLTTYGTDQSMVQRYLTTSSQKSAQRSVLTNAILTIPATIIFFFIGTALFVFYKTYPQALSVSIDSGDAIFPWYIFSKLPAGMSGLLISGIFAAAMSTLSGSMNSAATAFVVDIRPRIVRRPSKRSELQIAKNTTLVIGILSLLFAYLMATWNINSLWDEFNKILGLILGSMGGLFMLGMITRRANSQGALIGIGASIIVQLCVAHFSTLHLLLYTSSGFISCFVVGYLASLFFKPNK